MLLILAGITIASLTGPNGILAQSEKAKIETRASQVEEIVNIWKSEGTMNEYYSDSTTTVKSEEELLNELLNDKLVNESEINRNDKIITIGEKQISYKTKSQLTDIYVALYNDGTLIFDNKNEFDTSNLAEGWTIENIKGKKYEMVFDSETGGLDFSKLPQWLANENITKVDFKNKIIPEYVQYWFVYLPNLSVIENISNLDTSNVTDMSGMFNGCSGLTNINLEGLDTRKVTRMVNMFGGCTSLLKLDVSNFDITYMKTNPIEVQRMFQGVTGEVIISSEWTDEMKIESEYKEL